MPGTAPRTGRLTVRRLSLDRKTLAIVLRHWRRLYLSLMIRRRRPSCAGARRRGSARQGHARCQATRGSRAQATVSWLVRARGATARSLPEAVRVVKRIRRANPVTGQRRSLRKISAELAAAGQKMAREYRGSEVPRPFNPATIKAMIEGPSPLVREQETKI